jgi:phospholipase/carboxylesterase
MKRLDFAGVGVRVVGGTDGVGGGDGPVVVLMHGFGARGDDLVPLWRAVDAPRGTRWVFPEAPLVLQAVPVEGRAWWPIDIEEMMAASDRGGFDAYARRLPPGLDHARERIVACLNEVRSKLGVAKLVLGGFSQGAILACDVALRTDQALAGLAVLSGTLVGVDSGSPSLVDRTSLPVFQSHGTSDELLPFVQAEKLRDALMTRGMNVSWAPFGGGHAISDGVLRGLGQWLRGVFEDRSS